MPIRFACPHCQQKLSVAARKAGQVAHCPRCKAEIAVPGEPGGEADNEPLAPPEAGFAAPEFDFSQLAGAEPAAAPARAAAVVPRVDLDRVSLPRWVIYVQAGLLAAVGFVCFTLGWLMGGTLAPGGSGGAQAVTLSGAVQFVRGGRSLPDAGAVVIALPKNAQADELAPPEGLRPGDPAPEAGARGLEIIRTVGGGYARTDANGKYQLRLPKRGTYHVLILSRAVGGLLPGELDALHSQQIAKVIAQPLVLVGEQKYQWQEARLSGDQQLGARFE